MENKWNKRATPVPKMKGTDVTERLRRLIKWRNENIPEGMCLTLEQIGGAVGITRERVRQIEAKALKRLRHPIRKTQLE